MLAPRSPTTLDLARKYGFHTWIEIIYGWERVFIEFHKKSLSFCFSSFDEIHHSCQFLLSRCLCVFWLRFVSNELFRLPRNEKRFFHQICCFCQELLRLMSVISSFRILGFTKMTSHKDGRALVFCVKKVAIFFTFPAAVTNSGCFVWWRIFA